MGAGEQAGFDDFHFSVRDGLKLYARDYGRCDLHHEGRLPLVCLPGLTRNVRDFHPFALHFSGRADGGQPIKTPRRVVAFDYRGRGRSEWDKDAGNYNLAVETEDVLTGLTALGIHRAVFVGTSRGALIIHMLAAVRPTVIAAAVLNDAGPVIEGAGLAQIKSYLTRMPAPKDWSHARDILRQAHGGSFTALAEKDWTEMAGAIYAKRGGKLVGDFDPALVKQLASIDFNTRLPTLWEQFDGLKRVPVMAVRGANSGLLSEATLCEMKARHPDLRTETVEGHGHAPLLHFGALPKSIDAFLTANGI